ALAAEIREAIARDEPPESLQQKIKALVAADGSESTLLLAGELALRAELPDDAKSWFGLAARSSPRRLPGAAPARERRARPPRPRPSARGRAVRGSRPRVAPDARARARHPRGGAPRGHRARRGRAPPRARARPTRAPRSRRARRAQPREGRDRGRARRRE